MEAIRALDGKDKTVVVFDLDNTIYDFSLFFVPAFLSVIKIVQSEFSVSSAECISSAQQIFDDHSSIEYENVFHHLARSIGASDAHGNHWTEQLAFNKARSIRAYTGVIDCLINLHKQGILLVAYTNAPAVSAFRRLQTLGVEKLFSAMFARDESEIYGTSSDVDSLSRHQILEFQKEIADFYKFSHFFPNSQRKPNDEMMARVLECLSDHNAIFVGDSMHSDLSLCQKFRAYSVWAKYGSDMDRGLREIMLRLSPKNHEVKQVENIIPNATAECSEELQSTLEKLIREANAFRMDCRPLLARLG